ncbi:hypothetical protein K3495_g409 [Podosphaera aphanis]|nr:hypothetical protein K3495_g409 [Podosphaera aphanis]
MSNTISNCQLPAQHQLSSSSEILSRTIGKYISRELRRWDDFNAQQMKIWDKLQQSNFVIECHFTAFAAFNAPRFLQRMIRSKQDLSLLLVMSLIEPVRWIIEGLCKNPIHDAGFGLDMNGSLQIEHHTQTFAPEYQTSEEIQAAHLSLDQMCDLYRVVYEERNRRAKSLNGQF